MILSKTIRLFLESLGRSEEVEFYLEKFQEHETPFFALVVPDEETLSQSGELLSFDLEFLVTLGLQPVLIVREEAVLEPLRRAGHTLNVHTLDSVVPTAGLDVVVTNEPAQALVGRLARRVHFLRLRGGLHTTAEEKVFVHYTERTNPHELSLQDTAIAAEATELLATHPGTHISFCSPLDLLREMFTVRGAGTLMRRGSVVNEVADPSSLDRERLLALLLDSFGRPLKDPAMLDRIDRAWLEAGYHGAALLEQHPAGWYLSKFAVLTFARGEGLAGELWSAMRDIDGLFWRARPNNPVNPWYLRQADGHHRSGDWIVFWRGIAPDNIPELVRFCCERPPDFLPKDTD